jgi:hypothetical protein
MIKYDKYFQEGKDLIIFYLLGAIIVGAAIYTFIRCIGSPNKNYDIRTKIIEEKVSSIGGTVEKIETSKSSYYPYIHELNQNDGSYHVFYKVTYRLDEETKEGWATLKLQQSMVGPMGASTNEWLWNL